MFERTLKLENNLFQHFVQFLTWMIIGCGLVLAQENADLGTLELREPSSLVSQYTYDPSTNRYIFSQEIGGYPISVPLVLSRKSTGVKWKGCQCRRNSKKLTPRIVR